MKLRDNKTIKISVDINIEDTLGKLTREQYLDENPHGYTANKKVHKNKRKYNRKNNKQW